GHEKHQSLWVDFSNENYDPRIGHQLYKRYLSEMVLADKLGYDGLVLNEHHNTQYSMNPAPNLTAAALIPQTTSWISLFGTPPNRPGWPRNTPCSTSCRADGCASPPRSAPAWSTGPTPSIRPPPAPASVSRSTSSSTAGRTTAHVSTTESSTRTATSTRGPS